eukprot:15990354-Heterocapsa_arctica.AAC.1
MGRSQTNCCICQNGNIKIDVHSHGNAIHTFNTESDDEQNTSTINLLWCNINKWGAQPNHYDPLHPIEE